MAAKTAAGPPDGGWGWVVVASSFCIHFCIDGITYAFGVLAAELVDSLDCSRQLIGWIASVMVGITLGGGPVASVACAKFGHRCVTIAGACIACCGYVASFFVTEAWVLIVTAGVIVGFGMSLIYLPAIVCVGIYFDRRRSTAIGIAVCGSGFGTFVFSPVISALIQMYTWRGATLLLGGVVLQCAVFGALFRPLQPPAPAPLPEAKRQLRQLLQQRQPEPREAGASDFLSAQDVSEHSAQQKQQRQQRQQQQQLLRRAHSVAMPEGASATTGSSSISLTHVTRASHFVRSIGSIAAAVADEAGSSGSAAAKPTTLRSALRSELAALLNLSLMRNPAFVLFVVSNLLCSVGFNAPFLYVPDRAQRAGVSATDSSLLVSVIGIANMIGRVCFGALSDRRWVDKLMLYNTALTIAGVILVFSFLSSSYVFMAVYCSLFGIFIGTYVTLTSPVLVDLLGLEQLSNSFGMTLLFQGIGVLIGPPVAGYIFDSTASFDIPFIVCGACVVVSGVMLYPVHCIQRRPAASADTLKL